MRAQTETHFIGKDGVDVVSVQKGQPVEANELVGLEGSTCHDGRLLGHKHLITEIVLTQGAQLLQFLEQVQGETFQGKKTVSENDFEPVAADNISLCDQLAHAPLLHQRRVAAPWKSESTRTAIVVSPNREGCYERAASE